MPRVAFLISSCVGCITVASLERLIAYEGPATIAAILLFAIIDACDAVDACVPLLVNRHGFVPSLSSGNGALCVQRDGRLGYLWTCLKAVQCSMSDVVLLPVTGNTLFILHLMFSLPTHVMLFARIRRYHSTPSRRPRPGVSPSPPP